MPRTPPRPPRIPAGTLLRCGQALTPCTLSNGPPVPESVSELIGCDTATGQEIIRRTTLFSDGTTTTEFTDMDGNIMSTMGGFSAQKSDTEIKTETVFDTDTATGAVVEIQQIVPITVNPDGTIVHGTASYRTADGGADYTPVGTIASEGLRVDLGSDTVSVTGATAISLADGINGVPANAARARVFVDSGTDDAAGIRYTVDGSAPTDDNGFQQSAGAKAIELMSAAEIAGFRALALDGLGELDATVTAPLTVEYDNGYDGVV